MNISPTELRYLHVVNKLAGVLLDLSKALNGHIKRRLERFK
jgi:hypothetical protein